MNIDTIFLVILSLIIIIPFFFILIYDQSNGCFFKYKTVYTFIRICKKCSVFVFTIINFIFGIIGLNELINVLILLGINILLFIYFLYDAFYLQPRTSEYIRKLQLENIIEISFEDMFNVKETTNLYKIRFDEPNHKTYFLINVDGEKCFYKENGKINQLFYLKDTTYTEKQIDSIGEQLNLGYDKFYIFKNSELEEFSDLKNFDSNSKIYLFFKKKFSGNNKLYVIVWLLLFIIIYILFIAAYFIYNWNFLDFMIQ